MIENGIVLIGTKYIHGEKCAVNIAICSYATNQTEIVYEFENPIVYHDFWIKNETDIVFYGGDTLWGISLKDLSLFSHTIEGY